MAGQGVNRRDVLRLMTLAAAAAQVGGFERWTFADPHAHHAHLATAPANKKPEPFKPRFFRKHEYLTLVALTDILIPADDTPGAVDAGASEFIDFIVAHDDAQQKPFRQGLKWLDQQTHKKYGRGFIKLNREEQNAFVETIQSEKFFELARSYTVMGYYTSKIGMEALGVPTLQSFAEAPACPHHGDPLHKNLGTT